MSWPTMALLAIPAKVPTMPESHDRITFEQLAQAAAAAHGRAIDEQQAGYVLWNHTGFPSFFAPRHPEETGLDVLWRQLNEFFESGEPV